MSLCAAPRRALARLSCTRPSPLFSISIRSLHNDGRNRLSNFWTPTAIANKEEANEDPTALLNRAGFIRQTHSGFFQFLSLGLRVQEKVEKLLDHHMRSLGASKISLSTFSSQELWRKSGRLSGDKSELFQLEDRKGSKFLLAPTHEEEITSLVSQAVHSYKDLPLRIYQVTRKYRDELRPRGGLLRAREFLMKDLYTFDSSKSPALATYSHVSSAYSKFFSELKIPFFVAKADSGSIGGDISHEYHIASEKGEDTLRVCTLCSFVANAEVLPEDQFNCPDCSDDLEDVKAIELGHTFYLGTKYSKPLNAQIDTETLGTNSSTQTSEPEPTFMEMGCYGIGVSRLIAAVAAVLSDSKGLNWPRVIAPFEVIVIPAPNIPEKEVEEVFDELGASSNELGAISNQLGTKDKDDQTRIDTILDDRPKPTGWKLNDADLIGYPVIVVLGKSWKNGGRKVEVQCRRLDVREDVEIEQLRQYVQKLLEKL